MVIKGRARGGPAALATHLERRDTNEKVSVRELRGVTSRDIHGALREMDCMGAGAVSTRTLYHAAINTASKERLTEEQKQQAIDRLETELGFTGQPRIIVEHLKKDREHIHVVFLRIDTDRMVAVPDSHNYRRHEIVARELEREFGHQHVQGAHIGREGQERPKRTPGHDEMQQAERSGLSPQQAKEQLTRLWNQADSGKAFAAALAGEGWVLTRGDKRDFVLVDRAGETHSLARRIEGAKAADVHQRMADIDPTALPSVADAKALQRTATSDRIKEKEKPSEALLTAEPPILKVTAPPRIDPATPLQPVERPGQPVVAERKPAPPQSPEPAEQKQLPRPTKVKQLYEAATGVTKRVYSKAKSIFVKKPSPEPGKVPAVPVARSKPPMPLPPTRAPLPKTSPPRMPEQPKVRRSPMAPTPKKRRLSREEIDQMIGRQQARWREHRGPSR